MTYLDEAYRRFKLPIHATYSLYSGKEGGRFIVLWNQDDDGEYASGVATTFHDKAIEAYLAAVKELSHD